jgi:hypothetical protein
MAALQETIWRTLAVRIGPTTRDAILPCKQAPVRSEGNFADVGSWHIATFRCDADLVRFRQHS